MQWHDVYNAACRVLSETERKHGKGKEYRAAIEKLREIEDLRCSWCVGFGWNNKWVGHMARPDSEHSINCRSCNGTGFELDLGKIAERTAARQ